MKNGLEYKQVIGKGHLSVVYLSYLHSQKIFCATKVISKKNVNAIVDWQIKNEIRILKGLSHPNIIKYIGSKITDSQYIIITAYYAGRSLLANFIAQLEKNKKPFSEEQVQHIMRQVVDGLKYLHNNNIIHRDLKLDNIFLQYDNALSYNNLDIMKTQVFIGDFGSAIEGKNFKLVQGTPATMSPSLLKNHYENNWYNDEKFDNSCDMWALGTICYQLITGERVFKGKSVSELYQNVEAGDYSLSVSLSFEIVSFINELLQYDRSKRATIEKISEHPFLKKNISEFKPINLSVIKSKISENKININIKNNKTIWNIFNENEKMLDNIPSSYFPDFLKVSEEAPEKNQVYQFEKETRYIEKQNNKEDSCFRKVSTFLPEKNEVYKFENETRYIEKHNSKKDNIITNNNNNNSNNNNLNYNAFHQANQNTIKNNNFKKSNSTTVQGTYYYNNNDNSKKSSGIQNINDEYKNPSNVYRNQPYKKAVSSSINYSFAKGTIYDKIFNNNKK